MKSYRFCLFACNAFLLLLLLVISHQTLAQEINKEVYVVKPYEPTLSDASKISFMPSVEDMETTIPSFTYTISPSYIETPFEVNPIRPARMISSSLPKIYKTFLKVGLGNYITPLFDFNISNLHSKDYTVGATLHHKSSHSNIILENDDKVPGGYAVSDVNLYGKKFFNNMTLAGNIMLDHRGFNYYGYNTHIFDMGSLPEMDRDDIRQRTILSGGQVSAHSTYSDSLHLNYSLSVRYNYLTDKSENTENMVFIKTSFSKLVHSFMGGIGLSLDYFKPDMAMDTIGNTRFTFSPYISKRSKDWKFVVGFDGVIDQQEISRFYFYPRGLLEFTVVEKIIIPFIGVTGKLETNHYQKIVYENSFITPGLNINNTSHKFTAFAGIKGSITNNAGFRADVSFTTTENMYFFVNDTTTTLENTFTADYDDIDIVQYHGELTVEPSTQWHVTADFNYYDYKMFKELKPWHKPEFDLTLQVAYNLKEKFLINGGLMVMGKRFAKTSQAFSPEGYIKLDPVADLNLGVEYLFSKVFTIFLDIYNITGSSYMLWNQYPSQRFNFMIGFTYKL
ncbi:MAG: TonB-dependent receptor [Bacteroidales bacterium]|nr:TonB-dependent receptor [Bacteroidales bacterium]MBN2764426.1 TonB-dependent receptor [Bacteroidales bacterium]